MGGVCSGGTTKRSVKPERNTLGFSGKLKRTKSFDKPKEKSYSYSNGYNSGITHQNYDPDDRRLSFSSELKPSTPARTGVTKVCFDMIFVFMGGISQNYTLKQTNINVK